MTKKEDIFNQNDLIFAQRLKYCRECAKLKQNELAVKADISPAILSTYEAFNMSLSGKKPSLHNAMKLAKTLGVSLDWLCGIDDAPKVSVKSIIAFLEKQQIQTSNGVMTITIGMPNMIKFLNGLDIMYKDYQSGIIDMEIFELWLSKCFKQFGIE